MDQLTPREYQVAMLLVARGSSNKEVARQPGLSEGTGEASRAQNHPETRR
jgi:DNA-binding NarL/FixJ family response regulator